MPNNKINYSVLVIAVVLVVVLNTIFTQEIYAQEEYAQCNEWQVNITPYFLVAGLNGTAGVKGITSDVDMSFSDILDKLGFGFNMALEVRKGHWGLILDGIYLRLEDQRTRSWMGPLGLVNIEGALDATMTQQIYGAGLNYRFAFGRTNLDLVMGARFTRIELDLILNATTNLELLPGGIREVNGKSDWVDPIIGARIFHNFNKALAFMVYQDFGGFGIGSDMTYQFVGVIDWTFYSVISAKLGYRFLYQNFDKDDFQWNTNISGPLLGIGFRF